MARNVTLQPKIWPQIDSPLKIVDRARTVSLPSLSYLLFTGTVTGEIECKRKADDSP